MNICTWSLERLASINDKPCSVLIRKENGPIILISMIYSAKSVLENTSAEYSRDRGFLQDLELEPSVERV